MFYLDNTVTLIEGSHSWTKPPGGVTVCSRGVSGVVAELAELALVNLVDQVDDVTTEYLSADDYPLFDRLAINFDLLL